jgi:prevent-host-death family protein
METWQLQEAKNKFSEVVERALHEGPQMITRHGKPAVVVSSVEDYEKNHPKPEKDFVDFLLSMPKSGDDEDLFVRIDSPVRDIDL